MSKRHHDPPEGFGKMIPLSTERYAERCGCGFLAVARSDQSVMDALYDHQEWGVFVALAPPSCLRGCSVVRS